MPRNQISIDELKVRVMKLKHEVDLKIKMVDDTGVTPPETGDANEESPSSWQGVWFEP